MIWQYKVETQIRSTPIIHYYVTHYSYVVRDGIETGGHY